jgi:putative ABC transport system ATP-binding protein
MRAPIVQLSGVSKSYALGNVMVHALKDINVSFEPGEFVVILGPSGCGKSTLLNIIGGLDSPTAGSVVVDGRELAELDDRELTRFRRETVGFVFQFFNLISTLNVWENVALAAEMASEPLPVDEVLESVGLTDRAKHFPSELSGGEQQRVAIARTLVKRSRILLCDEPTGELDAETGRRILEVLHQTTHTQKQTVLMVTHNAQIGIVADRVVRLTSGKIISDQGNPHPASISEIDW